MKKGLFALFLLFFALNLFAASAGDIVINEIAWSGTPASSSQEWIELYNTTDSDIDISGWSIYGADTGVTLNFSAADGHTTWIVPAGGYLVYGNAATASVFLSGATVEIWDATIGLNDTSPGNLILYDGQNGTGNVIDTAEDNASNWCAGNSTTDQSSERIDPCSAGNVCSNWASNDMTTRNGLDTAGNPINGTPGAVNSCDASTCGTGGDSTPPVVVSTTPDSGATGVAPAQSIVIVFNEAMNKTSAEGAFSISPDVTGKIFSWNASDTQMTVVHNNFSQGQLYTVTISTAAQDAAGNGLDGDGNGSTGPNYVFSFTTGTTDGSGTCTVNPTSLENGVFSQFTFLFTATIDISGGQVSILVPAGWTAPQSSQSNKNGYVSVTAGSGATVSLNGISGSGPWTILVDATNLEVNETFTLKYGDTSGGGSGSTCSTDGNYTFTTKSKGSGGTLTEIASSPEVMVFTPGAGDGTGTASLYYQDNDPIFAGGIGNYVYIDFTPSVTYPVYKAAMAAPANWTAPSTLNMDILLDGTTYLPKYSTYFSVSGQEITYDYYAYKGSPLTSSSYLQFRFKGMTSSSNTSDNGFIVKSSASDPATPVELSATSPVEVNMTSTKWYALYFNDTVDQTYAATPQLQATTVGKSLGTSLDNQLNTRIDSAVNYIAAAFYTAGLQSIEDALKNGNFANFRWWTEEDYWNSENNFHSDLESKYGGSAVRNDLDDGSNKGLSHNKFIVLDYNYTGSSVKDMIMTGSWNINESGTENDAQNAIFFQSYDAATLYKQEIDEFWAGRSGSSKTYSGIGTRYHEFSIGGGQKVQFGRSNNNVEIYMAPKDDVHSKIINAINAANDSLYFCIFTFTADDIYAAIKNRWLSGVQVEGVFDALQAGSSYSKYNDMVADGMDVKKDNVSGLLHHKYMIIDSDNVRSDPVVITGSTNWTAATDVSGGNDENTIIIHDANIANEFYQEFRARFGPSSNITPADADITPLTCATNEVKTITVTVSHNGNSTDNITKAAVWVPNTWTPAPTAANTVVKRNDGHYYNLVADVTFTTEAEGTWVQLNCPSSYEILYGGSGGSDSADFIFTNFTAPSSAGPTIFSTKVDWASNPNVPDLTETSPTPAINIRAGVVVVNEIFITGDSTSDWLELYCASGGPINIQNWYITRFSDSDSPNDKIKVMPDITLADGDFLLVQWQNPLSGTDETDASGKGDSKWDVYVNGAMNGQLIATDEQVVLKDNLDRFVDAVGWAEHSDSTFRTGETDDFTILIDNDQWEDYAVLGQVETTDFLNSDLLDSKPTYSFARKNDGFDNNQKEDWVLEAAPTPGAGNANLPRLIFNEVGYYNTTTAKKYSFRGLTMDWDWVELYCINDTNNGNGIDISNYLIDETNSSSGDHVVIPSGTIIKTGQYLLVMNTSGTSDLTAQVIDNTIAIYATFDLKNTHESYLTLRDAGNHILDFVAWSDYDCAQNFYATTDFDNAEAALEWKDYSPDVTCTAGLYTTDGRQIDCVNAAGYNTNDTLARDKYSNDTNDKVDWTRKLYNTEGDVTPGLPNCTPAPSGKMFVTPNKVRPSTLYTFTAEFVTENEPIEMYYIVIPTAFGDPNEWDISISGSDGGSFNVGAYGAATGGGTAVWVTGFTGDYLEPGATSTLTFTGITSPAALGGYTWYSGSKVVGESPYEVANHPVVTVLDGIILINEVHFYESSSSTEYYENHDWVELYIKDVNAGGLNISPFIITDLDGTDTAFNTANATTVHTGDYVIVHWITGGVDETDSVGDANGNGVIDLYVNDTNLTSTDDQAVLKNGTVYYDSVSWSNDSGAWSSGEQTDVQTLIDAGQWLISGSVPVESDVPYSLNYMYGDSLIRMSAAADNDDLYDWARTHTQTPGTANVADYDATGLLKVTDTTKIYYYDFYSDYSVLTAGTKWKFMYMPQAPISNGTLAINILPVADGWTVPNASFISVSAGENVVYGSVSVSGNIITVPVISMSQNDTLAVTYGTSNNVTVGTKAGNDFPFGTKITGSSVKYSYYPEYPTVNLVALAGDHIEVSAPYLNGMMVNDTVTFTIKLCDVYGNQAAAADPNAACKVTLTIDDFVPDNKEDINTTTLTSATNVSGMNDMTVTGNLTGGSATVKLIDYEPSSGSLSRTLRVTAVDNPVVLSGSATFTRDVTVYPPLSVKRAYSVYTSSSDKYREINVEFTAPFRTSTLGETTSYSLTKDSGAPHPGIDSFYGLSDNKILRVIPAADLIPGETYTITVYDLILDGLYAGSTIVSPYSAKFVVPYETGINIAVNETNTFDGTVVASGRYDLFPVWSPDGTKVAYVSNKNGVCNVYTLNIGDIGNQPVQLTTNLENVLYFSHISWGTDGYIYYATHNPAENHSRLFRRPDDGSGSPLELTTDTWHGWIDPDYCPAAQQPDAAGRLVVSIGGDLYAVDLTALPVDADNQDLAVIRLTELSDEYSATASRCLQPKWWWAPEAGYPDAGELKIAFVYESRTDNSTQIYVVNDVENIISTAISEGTGTPSNRITTLADARVTLVTHKAGSATTMSNTLPKWSPSWSAGNTYNGGIISFIQDENGAFDNAVFNNVSSSTAVADALAAANFNTYMTNWDDPTRADDNDDVNLIPQIIGNNPYNEAFAIWAPAGGDKLTYITKNGDTYALSILPIQTNVMVDPLGGVLFDNSFTQVNIPAGALTGNTMISVSPPSEIPASDDERLLGTGEVREFYADGSGITFEKPVTMIIAYADADQDGYVDGTTIYEGELKVWYYNENLSPASWELIGGEVDTDANTLTIQTDHFSTYGLFGYKAVKAFTLDEVRIYPNPWKPNPDTDDITFDQLPSVISRFDIFNIAGEKIIGLEDLVLDSTDPDNLTIVWNRTNDKGDAVASGIYILVIKDGSTKESKCYKFAVIR